ncbi:hypothetical protein Glove_12g20 [Diversispora epigaea]|uniref:BED-type domain-containing protein n=1 Tax=Diversispora epigaea TaxID=1348612 RepID=A0A397JP56_9GLOM|nr:hypothetical protein Glove_12g20 [Diversispora epigaea]
MGKEAHKFREFFTLIDPTKKTANKKVVCNFCIKEYTLSVVSCRTECFVSNKAKLCRTHLKKCINFERQVPETERIEILAWKIPENNKKIIKKQKNNKGKNEDSSEENKENKEPLRSTTKTQSLSNGLAFTFFENQETKDVFTFIAPALKLPSRKVMSDRILSKSTKVLTQSIIKIVQENKIGVTAAFDE